MSFTTIKINFVLGEKLPNLRKSEVEKRGKDSRFFTNFRRSPPQTALHKSPLRVTQKVFRTDKPSTSKQTNTSENWESESGNLIQFTFFFCYASMLLGQLQLFGRILAIVEILLKIVTDNGSSDRKRGSSVETSSTISIDRSNDADNDQSQQRRRGMKCCFTYLINWSSLLFTFLIK